MAFCETAKGNDEIFAHKIRTLSVSDLDRVVGGGPFESDDAGKGISAQDNQGKVMG